VQSFEYRSDRDRHKFREQFDRQLGRESATRAAIHAGYNLCERDTTHSGCPCFPRGVSRHGTNSGIECRHTHQYSSFYNFAINAARPDHRSRLARDSDRWSLWRNADRDRDKYPSLLCRAVDEWQRYYSTGDHVRQRNRREPN
jgi:hypothetical protein